MSDVQTSDTLAELAIGDPFPESFGPGTAQPMIALQLCGDQPGLAQWLRSAPCPVIGMGDVAHPLATACDVVLDHVGELAAIRANVAAAPLAAMVLVQHLRASEALEVAEALIAESLAFAAIQRGPEFVRWRASYRSMPSTPGPEDPVSCVIEDEGIVIELANPANYNAVDTAMRDALIDRLDAALVDPLSRPVRLTAQGRCFSIGGALSEFGQASDPASAHWVRTLRSPASRLAAIAPRLTIHVHGAAIGAGVEMACFASRVLAGPHAWFQLPELRYGLIPGAGGTVSIVRRIGRQRTAYMALSMRRISAASALSWGLVDAIES